MGRPHRGQFQAWLRGGQTVGHTYDMVLEVVGRLLIVCAIWGMVCFWIIGRYSAEHEETYGVLVMQAQLMEWVGNPLPQEISVKDLKGFERKYPVSLVGDVPWLKPYSDAYIYRFKLGVMMFICGVVVIGVGTAIWFTESGRSKLKPRQVRGQTVAALSSLILQVEKFNEEQAKKRNRTRYVPAKLVGVPYPYDTEHEHTLVAGAPGSGKSVALHRLLDSIRAREDRAVIYDPELEFIAKHYDPKTDIILNPFDERSAGWSPYADAKDVVDFEKLAHSMFKEPKSGDPYWTNAARQIFQWTAFTLKQKNPEATLEDLLKVLFGPTRGLDKLLEGTPAHKHVSGGGGPRVASLESVLVEGVTPLIYLSGKPATFSIRDWVNHPKKRAGFLFLSAPESHIDSLRPLIAFWSEMVVAALLSRHDTARLTTWLMLDEFPSLGKLDRLAEGPQRLRKYGGAVVLGMQQVSQIQDIYGHERARTIIGQCATKLILRSQDPETAQFMSELLGRRLIRRVEENTSYGANSIRDGVGLAPREELEPVALPEDIMNLPAFQGFIRLSNKREGQAFPISPLRFSYIDRPTKAPSFVALSGVDPISAYFAARPQAAPLDEEGIEDLVAAGTPAGTSQRNGAPPRPEVVDPRRVIAAAAAAAAAGGPEPAPRTDDRGEGKGDEAQRGLVNADGDLKGAPEHPDLVEAAAVDVADRARRAEASRRAAAESIREGLLNAPLLASPSEAKGALHAPGRGGSRLANEREQDRGLDLDHEV